MSIGIVPFFSFNELVTAPAGLTYGRWVVGRRRVTERIAYSDDALTWSGVVVPTNEYYSLSFSEEQGLIAAVAGNLNGGGYGSNIIITSTNSVTWTTRNTLSGQNLRGIRWVSHLNLWVALGADSGGRGAVQTSPDTITWSNVWTFPTDYRSFVFEIGYDGEYVIFDLSHKNAGNRSDYGIVYSNDLVNFSTLTIGSMADAPGNCRYQEGIGYLMTGFSSQAFFSATLSSGWIAYNNPGTYRIGGGMGKPTGATAVFVNGLWSGAATTAPIQYSFNGTTWTSSTLPLAGYGTYDISFSYERNEFVAVNSNTSNYMTSPDGIIWTVRSNALYGFDSLSVWFCAGVRTTAYKGGADK